MSNFDEHEQDWLDNDCQGDIGDNPLAVQGKFDPTEVLGIDKDGYSIDDVL